MLAFFVWELLMLGCVVALTLWMLAAKGTQWHVYLSVWVSWGFALALVALVPIDIHIVYLKRCIEHYGNNTVAQVLPRLSALCLPKKCACLRLVRENGVYARKKTIPLSDTSFYLHLPHPRPFCALSPPPPSSCRRRRAR